MIQALCPELQKPFGVLTIRREMSRCKMKYAGTGGCWRLGVFALCLGEKAGAGRGSREGHSRLGQQQKQKIQGRTYWVPAWIRKGLILRQDTEPGKAGKVLEHGRGDQRAVEMALLWEEESEGHHHNTEDAAQPETGHWRGGRVAHPGCRGQQGEQKMTHFLPG